MVTWGTSVYASAVAAHEEKKKVTLRALKNTRGKKGIEGEGFSRYKDS